MSNHKKKNLQTAMSEAMFVDYMKGKFGVPVIVMRNILSEVGISLPKVYDELRKLGYAVPL